MHGVDLYVRCHPDVAQKKILLPRVLAIPLLHIMNVLQRVVKKPHGSKKPQSMTNINKCLPWHRPVPGQCFKGPKTSQAQMFGIIGPSSGKCGTAILPSFPFVVATGPIVLQLRMIASNINSRNSSPRGPAWPNAHSTPAVIPPSSKFRSIIRLLYAA